MFPISPAALRLSLFYVAFFVVVGVHLPFWPLWLKEARGLDPAAIGWLFATAMLAKLAWNPFIGQWVDRSGERRRPLMLLSAGALLAFAAFAWAESLAALVVLTILASGFFSSMMPVAENLTLLVAGRDGFAYGRIRLWGSLSFIAAAAAAGWLIEGRPAEVVLVLVVVAAAAVAAATLAVPDARVAPADQGSAPLRLLVRHPVFLAFLGAVSLIQTSHMVYYAFGTLHWTAAGLPSWLVGLLWAVGVVAEILLFLGGTGLLARLGAAGLVVAAALAGVLRWIVLAVTTDPVPVALAQIGHAFTYGACHLGAIHFLTRAVPAHLAARAQAVYSSVALGALPGLAMLGAGPLYEIFEGGAFLAMALLCAGGLLCIAPVLRRWDGGVLTLADHAAASISPAYPMAPTAKEGKPD